MAKIYEVNTYLIRSAEENAYATGPHGRLLVDEHGELLNYDKDSVVDAVSNLINENKITKGLKVNNPDSMYVVYTFSFKEKFEDGTKAKYVHRIKVAKSYINDHEKIVNRLDALVKSVNNIKIVNTAKMLATGVFCLMVGAASAAAFYQGFKNEEEAFRKRHEEIIGELRDDPMIPPEVYEGVSNQNLVGGDDGGVTNQPFQYKLGQ